MPLPVRWRYRFDRWRRDIRGRFRSQPAGQRRPRLCPACGTLVGVNATRCHQCGSSMTFSLAAASRSIEKLLPHAAPVTYILVGLNSLIYVLSLVMTIQRTGGIGAPGGGLGGILFSLGGISGAILLRLGESLPLVYLLEQPWRAVMAIFLHGSLLHIGFNMLALINIGPMVEELYGSARYLFFFVVTGAAGFLASAAAGNVSVGASGAILGLVGALIAVTGSRKTAGARMIRGQLMSWVISIAVLGFFMSGIDNWAHGGGFVAGYLLARLIPDRQPADRTERRSAEIMGWTAAAAVAVSFVFMLINYFATTSLLG